MKHLIMEKPQCLLYSAAMMLDMAPGALALALGHDGMEVWWPQYEDHRRFRSHSMQEMIDIFLELGVALVPIHGCPRQAPNGEARDTFKSPIQRFTDHIKGRQAILIGKTENGNPHAWAWDGNMILDPRGGNPYLHQLAISEAWVMFIIKLDK